MDCQVRWRGGFSKPSSHPPRIVAIPSSSFGLAILCDAICLKRNQMKRSINHPDGPTNELGNRERERIDCHDINHVGRNETKWAAHMWRLKWLGSPKSKRVMKDFWLLATPLWNRTQVRFWIPVKIPTEYDYLIPRLPENAKIKILYVGSYFILWNGWDIPPLSNISRPWGRYFQNL